MPMSAHSLPVAVRVSTCVSFPPGAMCAALNDPSASSPATLRLVRASSAVAAFVPPFSIVIIGNEEPATFRLSGKPEACRRR